MAEIKFARMKFTDPTALKKACDAYFDYIDKKPKRIIPYGKQAVEVEVPPTMAGLARALGITTSTLAKYLRGEVTFPDSVGKKTEAELLRVLTDARMRIEDEIITRGLMRELDNTVVRQHMSMFGYTKSMDEAGEEANNTVKVIIQGASKEEVESWAK